MLDTERAARESRERTPCAVLLLVGLAIGPLFVFTLYHGFEERRVLVTRLEIRWMTRAAAVAGLDALTRALTRVTLWDASGRILLRHPDPEGLLGRDASTSEVWQAVVASRSRRDAAR